MRNIWVISLILLSGCSAIPIKITYDFPPPAKIIRIKDSNQAIIKAISIESGFNEAISKVLWDKYKLSSYKKLSLYLIKTNPEEIQDKYYIMFVERVKARAKILKRGYYENEQEYGKRGKLKIGVVYKLEEETKD